MTKFIRLHQPQKTVSYTQLPNFLFEVAPYKSLSVDAKLLYAFILRRAELSRKNAWVDEYERIYLYYPIDEVAAILHCGRQKAMNMLQELKEAELISVKKQGCGKPNRIYPKTDEDVPNVDFLKSDYGTPEG